MDKIFLNNYQDSCEYLNRVEDNGISVIGIAGQ